MALTRSVDELAKQVVALRGDLRRRTRRLWWWLAGGLLVGAIGLTVVIIRLVVVVDDLQAQQRGLATQQQAVADQQQASCVAFASVGRPELLSATASPLAREIVATHAEAARKLGCRP